MQFSGELVRAGAYPYFRARSRNDWESYETFPDPFDSSTRGILQAWNLRQSTVIDGYFRVVRIKY